MKLVWILYSMNSQSTWKHTGRANPPVLPRPACSHHHSVTHCLWHNIIYQTVLVPRTVPDLAMLAVHTTTREHMLPKAAGPQPLLQLVFL